MANTSITKSVTKDSDVKKFTFSAWIKRSSLGSNRIFSAYQLSTYWTSFYFSGNDQLELFSYINSSQQAYIQTTSKYRDVNGWYHIVLAVDTTQATASNRIKIYVNGEQQTALNQNSYPTQDSAMGQFNDTGATLYIGKDPNADFNGVMSHVHYTQGYTYAASDFGSTDSTTGEWKITTNPNVNYGNHGFFILKNGNSVTDHSGNNLSLSVSSGTLTKTEDNPSNVFATLNPLFHKSEKITFSNGNNTASEPSGNSTSWTTRWGISSIGFSSGKFYAEAKISDYGSGQLYPIGIVRDENIININSSIGSNGWGYYTLASGGGTIIGNEDGSNLQTSLGASTTGDIIGLAVDADNNTLQFYKNGSTLGSQVTGITAGTYFIGCNAYANFGIQMNFGNGYFGTTAVSSAGTNASNLGIFEYDVPSGFTALCTKGLNE